EIMRPEDVGVAKTSLVMGKLSGRNAFRDKLDSMGYTLEPEALNDAFKRFKDLADRKKHVFDDDIIALVDEQLAAEGERIAFKRLRVVAGTEGPQTAEIDLIIDGVEQYSIARGNGPVDAVFNAIRQLVPHQSVLELYQVHAVTGGTDAQATVSVRLNGDGIMATGRSSDPDTLVASAKAYLHALNKFEVRKAKRRAA
ncbi:MAG: alpha-isopropylmalate synthase regulatory domain-containing protein, partial [Ferrovibrio sp.]